MRKNIEIEALRGIAILLVLAAHYPAISPWMNHNYYNELTKYFEFGVGVDLFLCISGYLVSMSLLNAMEKSKSENKLFVFKQFFIKRAFRLFPSAYLWVAITLALTIFYNKYESFGDMSSNVKQTIAISASVYNAYAYYLMTYTKDIVAFGPYWSLSLEQQFYILLPITLFLFGRRWLGFSMLLMIVSQWVVRAMLPSVLWIYFRLDGMMLGVILFLISRYSSNVYRLLTPCFMKDRRVSFIINAAVIMLVISSVRLIVWPRPDIAVSLGAASLVWIASYSSGYGISAGLVNSALNWIGARAYAIYLLHMPMIRLNREIWLDWSASRHVEFSDFNYAMMTLTAIALIITASETSFRLIERPLTAFGHKLAANMRPHRVGLSTDAKCNAQAL